MIPRYNMDMIGTRLRYGSDMGLHIEKWSIGYDTAAEQGVLVLWVSNKISLDAQNV